MLKNMQQADVECSWGIENSAWKREAEREGRRKNSSSPMCLVSREQDFFKDFLLEWGSCGVFFAPHHSGEDSPSPHLEFDDNLDHGLVPQPGEGRCLDQRSHQSGLQ